MKQQIYMMHLLIHYGGQVQPLEDLVEVCSDIELFGLSRAVADAATGAPWKGQNIAAKPRQDGLLELLQVNKN